MCSENITVYPNTKTITDSNNGKIIDLGQKETQKKTTTTKNVAEDTATTK